MQDQEKKIRDFTDLQSWQNSHKLVLSIYNLSKKFPNSETFGLTSQIQRAVVSISSNIAEGFGRQTLKEKIQFYYQANGSLTEVKNQLIIAKDLKYISEIEFNDTIDILVVTQKLLQGLIRKTKSIINLKS